MNVKQDLVFNILGRYIVSHCLHVVLDQVDVVHLQTLGQWRPGLALLHVVCVLHAHDLVVLNQTVVILLLNVELMVV